MIIGNKNFDFQQHGYIMGILNVTPDSFSDGGSYVHLDQALYQTEQMIAQGASIIDVGGESTRPGHIQISVEEEIERVVPVIEAVKARFDVPVSLDTYKSEVAQAGVEVGVDLMNDIWGLQYDVKMAEVIAKSDIAVCMMHNRRNTDYHNYLEDVLDDLEQSLKIADTAGIVREKILLDPGIGFAKSLEQNLQLMKNLSSLQKFDLPILLGTSRKSMIGLTLDLPVTEREEGTIATTVYGYMQGARVFRVHDVEKNMRALRMVEAMQNA
ncbi:MAG: dihydropteroate synthase [Lachnospiraceae bacterium]